MRNSFLLSVAVLAFGAASSVASAAPAKPADLEITSVAPATFVRPTTGWTTVNYALTVTNKGGTAIKGVQFMDVIPSEAHVASITGTICSYASKIVKCNLGTMNSNASVTINILVMVYPMPKCKVISSKNTALVWATGIEKNYANNQVVNTTKFTCPVITSSSSSSLVSSSASSVATSSSVASSSIASSIPSSSSQASSVQTSSSVASSAASSVQSSAQSSSEVSSSVSSSSVPASSSSVASSEQSSSVISSIASSSSVSSVVSSSSSSSTAPIVRPTLYIAEKNIGTNDIAVKNQKNVSLLRFEASANEVEDLLLTVVTFNARAGSLLNAQNYALWVDTDGDFAVDTIIQMGAFAQGTPSVVRFNQITGGGYVIPAEGTVLFEVRADIASNFQNNPQIQLQFATNGSDYIEAETLDDGAIAIGVATNGTCASSFCQINVTTATSKLWNLVSQGSLFVTKDSTPVRSRQLLGGALGEAILRLQFRAEYEDIDVTDLQFTSIGNQAQSIDRLELFKDGETTPFTTATVGGCGTDQVITNYNGVSVRTFCSNTENRELVIPKGQELDVLVRPRMKTDANGGISGEAIQIFVSGTPISDNATGRGAVRARGTFSSNNLVANDGDNLSEGEIFIGTNTPAVNNDIVSNPNVTVLSKIMSITNADPDADNTSIPTGVRPIGQFRFTAATNSNFQNGNNKVVLEDIIFNVNAANVSLANAFKFYNKADSSSKHSCSIIGTSGTTSFVHCAGISSSWVNSAIDSGESVTFVLEADITNPMVNAGQNSVLQVSIQNFNDMAQTTLGTSSSHIRWNDKDAMSVPLLWIEYPDAVINSTSYNN